MAKFLRNSPALIDEDAVDVHLDAVPFARNLRGVPLIGGLGFWIAKRS